MMFIVDCEANGRSVSTGYLTEFAAVVLRHDDLTLGPYFDATMSGEESRRVTAERFADWIDEERGSERAIFWSDNPAYDWQWINDLLWKYAGRNPFGHSARRIGDLWAGFTGNPRRTQDWKRLRKTPHDHVALHDAKGNAEALAEILRRMRITGAGS